MARATQLLLNYENDLALLKKLISDLSISNIFLYENDIEKLRDYLILSLHSIIAHSVKKCNISHFGVIVILLDTHILCCSFKFKKMRFETKLKWHPQFQALGPAARGVQSKKIFIKGHPTPKYMC